MRRYENPLIVSRSKRKRQTLVDNREAWMRATWDAGARTFRRFVETLPKDRANWNPIRSAKNGYASYSKRNDPSVAKESGRFNMGDARGHVLESLLLFPLGSPRIQDAANAPVQKGISIRLESNLVPPMSPSLVKWIPPLETAFSFQDWFIPVQELRAGRGSIAAERNTGCRAGCVGVYADVIDHVSTLSVVPRDDTG